MICNDGPLMITTKTGIKFWEGALFFYIDILLFCLVCSFSLCFTCRACYPKSTSLILLLIYAGWQLHTTLHSLVLILGVFTCLFSAAWAMTLRSLYYY